MTAWNRVRGMLTSELSTTSLRNLMSSILLGARDNRLGNAIIISFSEGRPAKAQRIEQAHNAEYLWEPSANCFGTHDQHASLVTSSRALPVLIDIPPAIQFSFEARVPGDLTHEADNVVANNFPAWAPFPGDEVFYSLGEAQSREQLTIIPVAYTPKAALASGLDTLENAGLSADGVMFPTGHVRPVIFNLTAIVRKALRRNRSVLLALSACLLAVANLIAWEARLTATAEITRQVNAARSANIRTLRSEYDALPPPVREFTPSGAIRFLTRTIPENVEIQIVDIKPDAISLVVPAEKSSALREVLERDLASVRSTSLPGSPHMGMAVTIGDKP